ncbi:MAG: hypothetical protein Q8N14_02780 [Candidatus Omnitrophota bacterium]|nr:hypothetical protein [Candidatus Omnitrophota bacterium]
MPVVLGRKGIEQVIELELTAEEKKEFLLAAEEIKKCMTSA